MFRQVSVVMCLVATCGTTLAQASVARPGAITGSVLINRGTGFVRLASDTNLVPGDRLLATRGAQTTIVYSDGCVVKVKPGSTATVGSVSPCKMTAQADDPRRDRPDEIGAPLSGGGVGGVGVSGAIVGAGAAAAFGSLIYLATRNNGGNGGGGNGGGGGGGGTPTPISP